MLYAKFKTGGGVLPVFWLELPVTSVPEANLLNRGIAMGYFMGSNKSLELVDLRLSRHPSETTYSFDQVQEFLLPQQPGEARQKD